MNKDTVILKGGKHKSVYLRDITLDDLRAIFFPKNTTEELKYLGDTWNLFNEGTYKHILYNRFLWKVDKLTKPWWCPRVALRLLHVFGNDRSVVRVRNWTLHRIFNWIVDDTVIFQTKVKYGTIRVYGHFNQEIYDEITKLEKIINPMLEAY